MSLSTTLNILPSNPLFKPEFLKDFSDDYLTEIFHSFFEKTSFIQTFSSLLASDQMNPSEKDTLEKVHTFVLHYLSRGSTIPIHLESEKTYRSPLDYFCEKDNAAKYYRGDGGPICEIILKTIEGVFEDVETQNKYQIGLVKPQIFPVIMKKACAYEGYEYSEVDDLSEIDDSEGAFFDASSWIKESLVQGWWRGESLNMTLESLRKSSSSLGSSSVIGGVLEFNYHVGVYLFISPNNSQAILSENGKEFDFICSFLNLQGYIGAFPEMMLAKSTLSRIGFQLDLENSREVLGESDEISCRGCAEDLQELPIDNAMNQPLRIYLKIISNILRSFSEETSQKRPLENWEQKAIGKSLREIYNGCQKASSETSTFPEALNFIYLAIEEMLFLSIFFKPVRDFDQVIYDLIRPRSPTESTVLRFNSGMTSISYIVETAFSSFGEADLHIGLVNGSYYEISELKKYLKKDWSVKKIDPSSPVPDEIDLLLLDLYPNNVTLPEAEEIDVANVISQCLNKRTSEQPLVVVLDTSTTLLTNSKIFELVSRFKDEIENNQLEFITLTSLAKFYTCGLDKYSGGLVVYFGERKGFRDKMLNELNALSTKDPLSEQARTFFSLLFENAMDDVEEYYHQTIESTNKVYSSLSKIPDLEVQKSLLATSLQEKSEHIPVIGLQLKTHSEARGEKWEYTKTLEYYLFKQAQERGLPLLIRASFPFPHSAIVECDTALRFVAGLEAPKREGEYESLFFDLYNEMKTLTIEDERDIRDLKEIPELPKLQKISLKDLLFDAD